MLSPFLRWLPSCCDGNSYFLFKIITCIITPSIFLQFGAYWYTNTGAVNYQLSESFIFLCGSPTPSTGCHSGNSWLTSASKPHWTQGSTQIKHIKKLHCSLHPSSPPSHSKGHLGTAMYVSVYIISKPITQMNMWGHTRMHTHTHIIFITICYVNTKMHVPFLYLFCLLFLISVSVQKWCWWSKISRGARSHENLLNTSSFPSSSFTIYTYITSVRSD